MTHLQQGGPTQGLPPDPHARQGHRQDGPHHAVWPVRVLDGFHNAGNTFQRMMDLASHLQHLQLLFHQLREFGLVINSEKCEFGTKELDFLGHRV